MRSTRLRPWRIILLACLTLILCLPTATAGATPARPASGDPPTASTRGLADPAGLDALLEPLVTAQLAAHHVPGAQIAVVEDGRLIFAKGYGLADAALGTPATGDTTVFRAGSVAKLFTWTAVMQLVEAGTLDLHADVNTYLTTFQIPSTYPQSITLAHLLTHTAGFEERYLGGALLTHDAAAYAPLRPFLARQMPTRIFPPGQRVAYSNYGAALAGAIVEEVSGEPFERYVAAHILAPLQMRRTTFAQPLPPDLAATSAVGYRVDEAGVPQAEPFEYVQLTPAGALSTTAADMAGFMIAHLEDGRLGDAHILQPATVADMHRQHYAAHPDLPGLTWGFVERYHHGRRLLWHTGHIETFHSVMVLLPDEHVGIYMAFNTAHADPAREAVLTALLDRYIPPAAASSAVPSPVDGAPAATRVGGLYQSTQRSETTVEKLEAALSQTAVRVDADGLVLVQGMRDGAGRTKRWAAVAPLVFREVGGEGLLAFHADAQGQITTMVVGEKPIVVYEKLPWHADHSLRLLGVGLALLALLLSALGWLAGGLVRRLRRRPAGRGRLERWARPLAGGVLLTNLLVAAGVLVTLVVDQATLGFALPPALLAALGLGLLSGVGTAVMLACAVQSWRQGAWGLMGRLHYTLATLAALGVVWYLHAVNLLGFRI